MARWRSACGRVRQPGPCRSAGSRVIMPRPRSPDGRRDPRAERRVTERALSAFGAAESAMIASEPSQARADSAARILGTIPPAMTPRVDERLGLADGQRVELGGRRRRGRRRRRSAGRAGGRRVRRRCPPLHRRR